MTTTTDQKSLPATTRRLAADDVERAFGAPCVEVAVLEGGADGFVGDTLEVDTDPGPTHAATGPRQVLATIPRGAVVLLTGRADAPTARVLLEMVADGHLRAVVGDVRTKVFARHVLGRVNTLGPVSADELAEALD